MGGLFSPSTPQASLPRPPIPTRNDEAVRRRKAEALARRRRRGRKATILTGSAGDTGEPLITRPQATGVPTDRTRDDSERQADSGSVRPGQRNCGSVAFIEGHIRRLEEIMRSIDNKIFYSKLRYNKDAVARWEREMHEHRRELKYWVDDLKRCYGKSWSSEFLNWLGF